MESHYNKDFQEISRKLRKESTPGEKRLWNEVLKERKLYGYQFNRQFSIETYIVDFICRKLKIVIEIDGYSHNFKYDEDVKRDKTLNELGYKVVRFSEYQVMNDLPNVIRALEIEVADRKESIPQPPFLTGL